MLNKYEMSNGLARLDWFLPSGARLIVCLPVHVSRYAEDHWVTWPFYGAVVAVIEK